MNDTNLIQQRRQLIDQIAVTRARSIRVALFGTQLHRPDPEIELTEERRAEQVDVLLDTAHWLERTAQVLETGSDPEADIPQELSSWLRELVAEHPEVIRQVRRVTNASARVAEAARDKTTDLGPALAAHYEARRQGFMDVVSDFCDAIWSSIEHAREQEVERAIETGRTIQKTLGRLERIGQHVHLVSLNASVESARLGDAGKGITVIAVEFKSLAEEIEKLATTARGDIETLTKLA